MKNETTSYGILEFLDMIDTYKDVFEARIREKLQQMEKKQPTVTYIMVVE